MSQLAEFRRDLQQRAPQEHNLASLAADFARFESFITLAIENLQSQVTSVIGELDRLEMRGRRKILLFHGVPEAKKETVTSTVEGLISSKFQLPDSTQVIVNRCHRMGPPQDNKTRPVLVEFRDASVRDKLWSLKSGLKGTGITLSEFLTKPRHEAFMAARRRFGITRCWTREGNVIVLGSDGTRHRLATIAELNKVPGPELTEAPRSVAATRSLDTKLPATKTRRTAAVKK